MNVEKGTIYELHLIGPKVATKLKKAGILRIEEFLQNIFDQARRRLLSAKTGISEKKLQRWARIAQLYQIEGIDNENAELFEASGIEGIEDLLMAKPEELLLKMKKINEIKKLVVRLPDLHQIIGIQNSARHLGAATMV
jgi:hypothetical protein